MERYPGFALDFSRDEPGHGGVAVTAGGITPDIGRNPSGTASRLYFRFHQKYRCSGMPFFCNKALDGSAFLPALGLDRLDLFSRKHNNVNLSQWGKGTSHLHKLTVVLCRMLTVIKPSCLLSAVQR